MVRDISLPEPSNCLSVDRIFDQLAISVTEIDLLPWICGALCVYRPILGPLQVPLWRYVFIPLTLDCSSLIWTSALWNTPRPVASCRATLQLAIVRKAIMEILMRSWGATWCDFTPGLMQFHAMFDWIQTCDGNHTEKYSINQPMADCCSPHEVVEMTMFVSSAYITKNLDYFFHILYLRCP